MFKPIADEAILWQQYKNNACHNSREKLFLHYYPYARMLAKLLYRDRVDASVDFFDYVQLACTGLLEAIERYDYSVGVQFKTYAEYRIRGSVLNGAQKLTERTEQIAMRTRRSQERVRSLLGAEDKKNAYKKTFDELVDVAVGVAIGFMLEDGSLLLDKDRQDSDPAVQTESKQLMKNLFMAVEGLNQAQREVIFSHYYAGVDFQQIANHMELSKSRVSQIHKEALNKLREKINSQLSLNISV